MKPFLKTILILITTLLGYLNYNLYNRPTFIQSNDHYYNADVYHQLQFLKRKIHAGAGQEMQDIFPEVL